MYLDVAAPVIVVPATGGGFCCGVRGIQCCQHQLLNCGELRTLQAGHGKGQGSGVASTGLRVVRARVPVRGASGSRSRCGGQWMGLPAVPSLWYTRVGRAKQSFIERGRFVHQGSRILERNIIVVARSNHVKVLTRRTGR